MCMLAICDDNPEQLVSLEAMVRQALPAPRYRLESFQSAESLLAAVRAGRTPDILLLDICMPHVDGIAAAREINRLSPATEIIFITAFSGYAVEVYEAEHIYLLTKPILRDKLRLALTRATERIAREKDARLVLPVRGSARRIFLLSEIVFFERRNHNTIIRLLEGGTLTTVWKLSEIEALLPENAFARPHNSYLVNLARVRSTTRTELVMSNGAELPISSQRRADFMAALAGSI